MYFAFNASAYVVTFSLILCISCLGAKFHKFYAYLCYCFCFNRETALLIISFIFSDCAINHKVLHYVYNHLVHDVLHLHDQSIFVTSCYSNWNPFDSLSSNASSNPTLLRVPFLRNTRSTKHIITCIASHTFFKQ